MMRYDTIRLTIDSYIYWTIDFGYIEQIVWSYAIVFRKGVIVFRLGNGMFNLKVSVYLCLVRLLTELRFNIYGN